MFARRIDANQSEIVAAARKAGASVLDLHNVGRDCPDILVGWNGNINLLVEVKSPRGRLSPGQKRFIRDWRGYPVYVVRSAEAMIELLESVEGKA
jgi:hypothetical protein